MSAAAPRRRTQRTLVGLIAAGLITASLAAPASAVTLPSPDWYGYVVTGSTYTSTTADWTMPAVSCHTSGAYLAIWTVTQGWTQTVTKPLAGAARSAAETLVEPSSTFRCPPPVTLANVTGDTVDGSALGSLAPVKVTGGSPVIHVSPVTGETFTVTC